MSKKRIRPHEDVIEKFQSQIRFLKRSMNSFDDGFEDEAQRLAATLRILLFDKNQNHSMLSQMGFKDIMYFQSTTADYQPLNLLTYHGLVGIKIGKEGQYVINDISEDNVGVKWLSFNDWWNELVIDDKVHFFSRKDLILTIADKEGGAHVDSTITEEYAHLIKENSLGWEYGDGINTYPLKNNPAYVSIRQIAIEILNSVDFQLSYDHSIRNVKKPFIARILIEEDREYRYYIPDFSRDTSEIREDLIKVHEDSRVQEYQRRMLFVEKTHSKDGLVSFRNILLSS